MHETILSIESSCDETSVAVIQRGRKILANSVATSSRMHERWGGIVPEVAAREQLRSILPVLNETLKTAFPEDTRQLPVEIIRRRIDAVAVTVGPGLIGPLLIGVETAKTIAFAAQKPVIPVNHVLAHMYANWLDTETPPLGTFGFPAISLVVSGGHTELFLVSDDTTIRWLGGTIDDAAGEAFDKSARLLGFGSRGGVAIQQAASHHDGSHQKPVVRLPRPLMRDTMNFSFSGLKTAILREWNALEEKSDSLTGAFAYEVQESITDVLTDKTIAAATVHNAKTILLSGGVSANTRLREKMENRIRQMGNAPEFRVPPVALCTDNAAYIGAYAYFRGKPVDWQSIDAVPDLDIEVSS